ncbi:hypothetical protein BDD12DRAFT_856368 [Trichophaea hybrida]|nr:hypothetical protein BDD12DRAFT_856368 [Trichophaea hybrida]
MRGLGRTPCVLLIPQRRAGKESVDDEPDWGWVCVLYELGSTRSLSYGSRLIPLASVLAPGSLTTQLVSVDYTSLGNVNILNFSVEAISN